MQPKTKALPIMEPTSLPPALANQSRDAAISKLAATHNPASGKRTRRTIEQRQADARAELQALDAKAAIETAKADPSLAGVYSYLQELQSLSPILSRGFSDTSAQSYRNRIAILTAKLAMVKAEEAYNAGRAPVIEERREYVKGYIAQWAKIRASGKNPADTMAAFDPESIGADTSELADAYNRAEQAWKLAKANAGGESGD